MNTDKKFIFLFSIALAFLVTGFLIPSCHAAVTLREGIPLVAREALPKGTPGLARSGEVATGGIPLPRNSGITSVSQLGLRGASAGQFRALGHWPNGNIKWVLVDFPATLAAGGTASATLVQGEGNFGGDDLAADHGASITVNTGAASFTVRKAGFNIFDAVTVGAASLVADGAGKLAAIGKDGVEYASSNDAASTAVIEENGPVRTVVKATGSLKSSTGSRLMDYTVRLHFFKGSARVKGAIELKNASRSNAYLTRDFKSVEAVVVANLGAAKKVSFSRNGTLTTTVLPAGATAYLMQGFCTGANAVSSPISEMNGTNWDPPLPGTVSGTQYLYDPAYTGVRIAVGDSIINNFGSSSQWSDGVASIQDGSGAGVSLAYRKLASYYPGGFEFKDSGAASIELYSKYNAKVVKLGFGQHDTREVMWDFFTGQPNNDRFSYQLEYPLVVRAPFDYYAGTRALYGQSEFVTPAEQADFMNKLSRATAGAATNLAAANLDDVGTRYVWRNYPWSSGGGWNQNNHVGNDLLDHLRTGGGGFYLRGESRALFHNDSAFSRSDDFSTELITPNPEGRSTTITTLTSGQPDGEHTYLYGQPLYYYLSGNESAREGWLDYGEKLLRNNLTNYYALPNSRWLRGISNTMRNSVLVYEFSCEVGSCNNGLKTALEGAIAYQLDSRDKPAYGVGNQGRNLERGYLYWDVDVRWNNGTGVFEKRVVHSLYHNHIHFEALYQVWRVMSEPSWNYGRLEELEDYMTGLAKFYLEEWFQAPPATDHFAKAPWYFPYVQHYDMLLDEVTPYTGNGALAPYSVSRAAIWAYQQFQDPKYLDIGAHMVWEQPTYSQDSKRNPSELQDQAMMYTYANLHSLPKWQNLEVTSVDNGDGSYTLSWLAPQDARKYRIKYSGKDIVEWLGFDPNTRQYKYPPASYAPFFAANNVTEAPMPTRAGELQSVTLTGLPPGQKFAVKYLHYPVIPGKNLRGREQ